MLKHGGCTNLSASPLLPVFSGNGSQFSTPVSISKANRASKIGIRLEGNLLCYARRRVIYEEEDEEEDYGHNAEIAMIESYSESATDEVLLVRTLVDDQEEVVIIFKGFSSSLSFRTSPDPSRSVLPARAVIKSIDRIKGPFDPSNIEYLEKGLTWEDFKTRIQTNNFRHETTENLALMPTNSKDSQGIADQMLCTNERPVARLDKRIDLHGRAAKHDIPCGSMAAMKFCFWELACHVIPASSFRAHISSSLISPPFGLGRGLLYPLTV